ncbi:uncharacterized protein LOC144574081 [Carex rostrata]
MEKKEEEEGEKGVNGIVEMDNGEVIVETEIDFKPIEHPPEPPDEDLPIKCPIPDPLSLIIDEVFEEPCTDSLQTIADLLEQKEPSTEKSSGTDDEIEKHQIPLPEHATPTHKSPHQKFLQVFNQCKELHA